MAVSDLRIALGTFTRRKKKKKCVKPWMQWVWRRLAVASSSKWPLLRSQVGLPPSSSHPLPPHPHPLACCVKGPWFQGGAGRCSLECHNARSLARKKSTDLFCHISLTRLRHMFSVGCVGTFLWYFQSLLSKLLPTGIIRIYNIVYRMCFYSIIFIVSESFWSLQSIMLEVFYATVIIIIILVKTLYLTCS